MDQKQIDPGHKGPRNVLRTIGPILLGLGGLLLVIGIASFFMAFGGSEPPKYFWCAFIGIPLLGVGGAMTSLGFMGRIARYHAQEIAPVAKDTFNYMAEGTRDGVKTMAGAIGQGLSEGGFGVAGGSETKVRCHKCNALVDDDAKFCGQCGQALTKSKPCPQCSEVNDPDAKFCDNCGHPYG
jgi:RNA polymerase subunit RPABC4/transcription elongation factor Spt4